MFLKEKNWSKFSQIVSVRGAIDLIIFSEDEGYCKRQGDEEGEESAGCEGGRCCTQHKSLPIVIIG